MRIVIQLLCVILLAVSGAFAAEMPPAEKAAVVDRVEAFANTFATYDELFEAIETAVVSGDPELMRALTVSEAEFRDLVWPTLEIARRPKSNFTWEFVWTQHLLKHDKCLLRTSSDYRGQEFDIVDISFLGRTTDHGTFRVHRESEVEVVHPDGRRATLQLFGSILETVDGHYKIYSFIND